MKIQKVKGEPKRVTQTTVKPEYKHLKDWQLNPHYHFTTKDVSTFDISHLVITPDEEVRIHGNYLTESGIVLAAIDKYTLVPYHADTQALSQIPTEGEQVVSTFTPFSEQTTSP